MPQPRALIVGECNCRDFAEPVAFLRGLCSVEFAADAASACPRLRADVVDLVVVAMGWPGAFTHGEFEALREAAPFTPIFSLLGAWCEGEVRTGRRWHGAMHVYAHQLVPRLACQFAEESRDVSARSTECFSPPFTQTHEDRLLSDDAWCKREERISIAISAGSKAATDTLAEVVASAGWYLGSVSRDLQIQQDYFDVLLWDCAAGLSHDIPFLQAWRARFSEMPLVLLLGFPRGADYEAARNLGAGAIVSKPFMLEDLIGTIARVAVARSVVPKVVVG